MLPNGFQTAKQWKCNRRGYTLWAIKEQIPIEAVFLNH